MRRCKLLTHEKSTKVQQKQTNERKKNSHTHTHIGLDIDEYIGVIYEEIENVFVSLRRESER